MGPVASPTAAPALELLLAAIWRDLVVDGEQAAPARRRPAPAPGRSFPPAAEEGAPAPLPSAPLPSLAGGRRLWASPADRRAIRQGAALVRGHLRRLPQRWQPSEEARALAASHGLLLPPGHTFVRPHTRGSGSLAGRPIAARGLASLLAIAS